MTMRNLRKYRHHLMVEIKSIVRTLGVTEVFGEYKDYFYRVHVYRSFLGVKDGIVEVVVSDLLEDMVDDYELNQLRTRELIRLRDALMRDYGKKVFRGE